MPGAPRPPGRHRVGRFMMQVLWPAFLMAVVGARLADSREAAYTLGFFVFWLLFACASGITYVLSHGIGDPPDAGRDEES